MSNILPDQKVELILHTPNGDKFLSCYVKEVYADRLDLTLPYEWEDFAEYLAEAEEVKTKVYTRAGVLLYQALIMDSPESGEFSIEYNEEIAQILQRRTYTRIPLKTIVDCEYKLDDDDLDLNHKEISENRMVKYKTSLSCEIDERIVEAETIDIGGGGLKIASSEELPRKQLITFKINLFDDIITAKGILVDNDSYPELQYGVKFTQITPEDKDKIIKICFKIEGLLNRKKQ